MKIIALKYYDGGFMTQAFAFGGTRPKEACEAITYRSSLQNFLIDDGKDVILSDTGLPNESPDIAKKEGISDMDAAKLMIDEAKSSGVDAVKFQSYKAETIASRNSPAYWDLTEEPTTSQFELFQKFDKFGRDEYGELADYCKSIGLDWSSPFYEDACLDADIRIFCETDCGNSLTRRAIENQLRYNNEKNN